MKQPFVKQYFPEEKVGNAYFIREVERRVPKYRRAIFRCKCGKEFEADISNVKYAGIGCGCMKGAWCIKHGSARTPVYRIWASIKARCLSPTSHAYSRYGGRGIKMCPTWQNSFETFSKDMGPRPSAEYTVERVNNELGYEKANCVWATRKAQCRNTRNTIIVNFRGRELPLITLCEEMGLSYDRVHSRIKRLGYDLERAMFAPDQRFKASVASRNSI